jgi:hypothetical protein
MSRGLISDKAAANFQKLMPEWSKPFYGMSSDQADSEARQLADPRQNATNAMKRLGIEKTPQQE